MKLNRRHFLATIFVGTGLSYFSLNNQKVRAYSSEVQIMLSTAEHLYPTSSLGLGMKAYNLATYLVFVLQDQRILQEDRDYLLRGSGWIEEESVKMYKKSFLLCTKLEKETLLQDIVSFEWGNNYINYLFSYIFEAMLSAPIYGSNLHAQGWKFLEHQAGFPQPQTQTDITYG